LYQISREENILPNKNERILACIVFFLRACYTANKAYFRPINPDTSAEEDNAMQVVAGRGRQQMRDFVRVPQQIFGKHPCYVPRSGLDEAHHTRARRTPS
jgi:hypothetical protein